MVNVRRKGSGFEREIASLIYDHLGVKVQRDLEQYRASDHGDLIGLEGWVIECKRYKEQTNKEHRNVWWEQVYKASISLQQKPVLIYKFDRQAIRCVVLLSSIHCDYANQTYTATLDFDAWCMVVRESLA